MVIGSLLAGLVLGCAAVPAGAMPGRPGAERRSPQLEEHVAALDDYFLPSLASVKRGGTVSWDFTGTRTHSATDATGMGLYDSGLVAPGGPSFTYVFIAAGSYAFACTLHVGMGGHVSVPMHVSPATGPVSKRFAVRWASSGAAAGYVFDVRIQLKGGAWSPWQDGVTVPNATYRSSAAGRIRFEARLRQSSTGLSSDWSDPVAIRVERS